MNDYLMYIGGHWTEALDGRRMQVINPATEESFASFPLAGEAEARLALEAASKAQPAWGALPSSERAAVLMRVARRIEADKERLAKIIVEEQGKPYSEALGEVGGAKYHMEYAAGWALRMEGDVLESVRTDERILILKVPHGVVVGITPWNYPLAVPARKIAPALISGNAIVIKPHEDTPLSALELARLFEQEGLPPGILNVVTGTGLEVGAPLVSHPLADFVTVTGSLQAGRAIYTAAARQITPVSLELGGKAPFIVMDDADIDKAVQHAVQARMENCGQICTCNERTYVHERVYDEFVAKFVSAVSAIRMGDPMLAETQLGPKVSLKELERIDGLVKRAKAQGAEILTGGASHKEGMFRRGYWYPPTVIVGVSQQAEIVQEEVFGPVLPILKVDSLEEAIDCANDCKYGLSAYLFTENYRTVMQATARIRFGELFINRSGAESLHAYHSGHRLSGVGGDDGKYGLDAYMKKKTVYLNYSI